MEGYEFMDNGSLNVYVVDDNTGIPLTDATVRIATDDAENTTLVESPTDSLGRLSEVELPAPPLEYSMEPGDNKPYSEYSIFVSAPGYEEVEVNGAEIFFGRNRHSADLPAAGFSFRTIRHRTFCYPGSHFVG